jgi:hypothetical protein
MAKFKSEVMSKFVFINLGELAGIWHVRDFVSPGYFFCVREWAYDPSTLNESRVLGAREFSRWQVFNTLEAAVTVAEGR